MEYTYFQGTSIFKKKFYKVNFTPNTLLSYLMPLSILLKTHIPKKISLPQFYSLSSIAFPYNTTLFSTKVTSLASDSPTHAN